MTPLGTPLNGPAAASPVDPAQTSAEDPRRRHDAPTPPATAPGTLDECVAFVFAKNRITPADMRTVYDGVMSELENFY